MAGKLPLKTQNLSPISPEEASATASPARGQAMIQNLRQKLRPPPLEHTWVFWHDRQERKPQNVTETATSTSQSTTSYADRLTELHAIADVRDFWEVFNNFDVARLPMRDSVHLFHQGIKPIWEDPRNARGGSWTFRVHKDKVADFWQEICLLAVGGTLQEAITSERMTFKDDICGVSFSVRFSTCNISVWNRDAEHEAGIKQLLATILEKISPSLQPRDASSYYYKSHFEHRDFQSGTTKTAVLQNENSAAESSRTDAGPNDPDTNTASA